MRKFCRRLFLSFPVLAVDHPDILRIMVKFVERVVFGIFYNVENMIMAGNVPVLGKYPELVFPDQVIYGREPGCIDAFEDIAEPVPSGKNIHTSVSRKHTGSLANPASRKLSVFFRRDF